MGWLDGSAGKGACHLPSSPPEDLIQSHSGRRDPLCKLLSDSHVGAMCAHTRIGYCNDRTFKRKMYRPLNIPAGHKTVYLEFLGCHLWSRLHR